MTPLDPTEVLQIIDELENHNLFFRAFWTVSDIYLSNDISTACVKMVGDKIHFVFNADKWHSDPLKFKLFVICHEQLHVMLNHFKRLHFDQGDVINKNIAADISVNHHLIRNYDFDRNTDIPNWQHYCWTDTIFPDNPDIPLNETAEFYYALLQDRDCSAEGPGPGPSVGRGQRKRPGPSEGPGTMDDHSTYVDITSDKVGEAVKKSLNEYITDNTKDMSEQEKDDWIDEFSKEVSQSLDTTGDGKREQIHKKLKRTNHSSWKSLYQNIPKRIYTDKVQQNWVTTQRRFATMDRELMLPSEQEIDQKDIVSVSVYLDSSGSCIDHAQYFLQSSLSIHKKYFKVTYYGFGTTVYDIPPNPPFKLKGFGNESYQAVSDHVDQNKSVDAVLVFTDGQSKSVTPRHPKKWHWFITPTGTTSYINNKCNIYELSKYNWRK
jgi:predicted metal-dependent peptidase